MPDPLNVIRRNHQARETESLRLLPDGELLSWVSFIRLEIDRLNKELPEDQQWFVSLYKNDLKRGEAELNRRRWIASGIRATISPEVIADIKAQISLIDLFLDYSIPIHATSEDSYKGICPWHDDHNPSLVVWTDHYRCFGCGVAGDAYDLVQDREKCTFIQSVRKLAERVGIKIETTITFCLADLSSTINATLQKGSSRAVKKNISKMVCQKLIDNGRLFRDLGDGEPYLLADDKSVVPLTNKELSAVRIALADAGFNPTEPAFAWLFEDLRYYGIRLGKPVRLARWSGIINGKLAISCGPISYITIVNDQLAKRDNGDNDIYFASNSVLPEWDCTKEAFDLFTLPAFNPFITIPLEAPNYTVETQQCLILIWACAVLMGIRPVPILAALGGRGSGKSALARSLIRIFLGENGDVTPMSSDERDFWAIVQGRSIIGLDNIDSPIATWIPDALAVAATGGRRQGRQFYTKSDISDCSVSAAVIVTSRTANFARSDVAERLLPIVTQELPDETRKTDASIKDSVIENRDGILVSLSLLAESIRREKHLAPSRLPARFLDFAEIVWTWGYVTKQEDVVIPMLNAWRLAQLVSVGDADPLLTAIIDFAPVGGIQRKQPADFIRILSTQGATIPYLGGGKAIARHLREIKSHLALAEWSLSEEQTESRVFFTLTKKDA